MRKAAIEGGKVAVKGSKIAAGTIIKKFMNISDNISRRALW